MVVSTAHMETKHGQRRTGGGRYGVGSVWASATHPTVAFYSQKKNRMTLSVNMGQGGSLPK